MDRNFTTLPDEALLRVREFTAPRGPLPYGRSKFLDLVSNGEAPQPAVRKPRLTAWRWLDIRNYLVSLAGGE
jgi:predicted DNA-binding transcriptional regulator AlpA